MLSGAAAFIYAGYSIFRSYNSACNSSKFQRFFQSVYKLMNILPTLSQLYSEHVGKVSDKWFIYISEYQRLFEPIRQNNLKLLEIGVQNGGSLEIWAKYFPNAKKIIGCEINEKCRVLRFDDARISLIIGDANTDVSQAKILRKAKNLDLIIDDGSHSSGDIVRSFFRYFPYLSDGGIYVIEDLHCSYWSDFEGGLKNSLSSISFLKLLIDILNREHWVGGDSISALLGQFSVAYNIETNDIELEKLHSIEFFNSVCVIRKKQTQSNLLGTRVVVGKEAAIDSAPMQLNGSTIIRPSS